MSLNLFAQVTDEDQIQIETLAEDTDGDFQFESIADQLSDKINKPIDINKASYDELQELQYLSEIQINAIIKHREEFGKFITIYELQSVPYIELEELKNIEPYITTKGEIDDYQVPFGQLLYKGKREFTFRYQQVLEDQEGYIRPDSLTHYEGSQQKFYTRLRYRYGTKVSYGILGEKDAGESFFSGTNKKNGFDFYSYHFFIRDIGPVEYLAVGDYDISFGQGLITWAGLGFGKSASTMQIKKVRNTIKPYFSVNESRFFRGGAIGFKHKNWHNTLFVSYKNKDANVTQLDSLDNDEILSVSSIQEAGLHRTESEISDKGALKELVIGGNVYYQKRNLKIGLNAIQIQYNADLIKSPKPYNVYDFSGDRLLNASIDYSYVWQNINFFGETAISNNGGIGTLNSAIIGLDRKVNLSILHRYYAKDFQTIYGNAFSESSRAQNENGLYFGLEIAPKRQWIISAYADLYKHPWLKFNADAPSHGADYLVQLMHKPSRKFVIYTRYRDETKWRNQPQNDTRTDFIIPARKQALRFDVKYKLSRSITLGNRVEFSRYTEENQASENGFLAYQDIAYKPLGFPLSLTARLAIFDMETYDSRIYAYENDVLYTFSIPAYSNKGMRYYLNLGYRLGKKIDMWFRVSQTYYTNIDEIGSGLEKINGNKRTEIKAQMRLKF